MVTLLPTTYPYHTLRWVVLCTSTNKVTPMTKLLRFLHVFLQAPTCIIRTFLVTGLCLVMGQLTLPHKIGKENPELVSLLELTNKTNFSRPGYNSQGPWIQTPPKIEVRMVLWTNLCLKFPKWTCGGMEIHMCNQKKKRRHMLKKLKRYKQKFWRKLKTQNCPKNKTCAMCISCAGREVQCACYTWGGDLQTLQEI